MKRIKAKLGTGASWRCLAVVFATCVIFGSAFGQEKTEAILVDTIEFEYLGDPKTASENPDWIDEFSAKIKSTKEEWNKYPDARVILIGYMSLQEGKEKSHVCDSTSSVSEYLDGMKRMLSEEYGFPEPLIETEERGLREKAQIQIWVMPEYAQSPQSGPTAFIHCRCGELEIRVTPIKDGAKQFVQFTADQIGGDFQSFGVKWQVNGGKILNGQGTQRILVEASEAKSPVEIVARLADVCCACLGIKTEAVYENN